MTMIARKRLPRRTVLRGLGTALALPLLDGMIPALTPVAKTAARQIPRFGVVYAPNGMQMTDWLPAGEGEALELSPTLQPLAPFQRQVTVLVGLDGNKRNGGLHANGPAKFLTGLPAKSNVGTDRVEAGVSMDQILAESFAQHTQLGSLELALEPAGFASACDIGFSCAYTTTISWRTATTPLTMEHNPRVVFERLFGDAATTDARVRSKRIRQNRSILDSIMDELTSLQQGLGPGDQARLSQYTEAVRDVERRIQKAEEQAAIELPKYDQPPGVPTSFVEHAGVMYDLQLLAYQSDLTRVITFMLGREYSNRTYPEAGTPDAHHSVSHHQNDPAKLALLAKINRHHVQQFANYLEKLRAVPDGEGTLLDSVLILYGAGLSESNGHSFLNLPLLLVGGGDSLRGGRVLRSPKGTPMANLHLSLLQKFGVPRDALGDSTGVLSL